MHKSNTGDHGADNMFMFKSKHSYEEILLLVFFLNVFLKSSQILLHIKS